MTITITTSSSGPYVAAASTTFAVTFQSAGPSEIEVTLGGVVQSPSLYVFTRDADGTGEVVFTQAVTGSVEIFSKPNFQQPTSFARFGAFFPDLINTPIDRLAAGIIYLKTRVALLLPDSLNTVAVRANKFLAWDAEGIPIAAVGGVSIAPSSAFGASLVASATADAARSILGTNISNHSALALIDSKLGDVNIVVLSDSTGDAITEWPYLLAGTKLGVARPELTIKTRYWTGSAYAAATTLQTGTGTKTVTFFVGAVAGTTAGYFAGPLFSVGVAAPAPDLIFISYGHNGDVQGVGPFSITPTRQLSFFNGLADKIEKDLPTVPVFMIGQNPSTSNNGTNPANTNDGFMETRLKVLRPLAAQRGWNFIDVHGAFLKSTTPLVNLLADAVHPNPAGSALWANAVWERMQNNDIARNSEGKLLRGWASRLDFSEWGVSNVTVTKNTTAGRYQTLGQSTVLTVTSIASGGYIFLQALTGDDIPAVAGRYVTFAVWMRNPATNLGNPGRLEVDDGVLPITVSSGMVQGDGFTLFTATHYVSPTATTLTLYLYAADAAQASANVIDVDRASISLGTQAIDPASTGYVRGRNLRISGSGNGGIGALYNVATSAAGLRFTASDTADPLTAWTSDFRQDGFAVKQAADVTLRYEVTTSGGFRMGGGAAATDMGIDRQLAGIMRFSGADLYPDTANTRYIGASGTNWRGLYLRGTGASDGLFCNDVRVVGAQGAAVANATDAATAITQLNALLARCRDHGLIAT